MGTKRTSTSLRNEEGAFGSLGQAHEFDIAMARLGVKPNMSQQAIVDPMRRIRVASAMQGEMSTTIGFGEILNREIERTKQVCEMTSLTYPSDEVVALALKKIEAEWGGVSEHDRFVPAGLTRLPLLTACQTVGLELSGGSPTSADYADGEQLPTIAGVIRQDLRQMMAPTDLVGRPFNLSMKEQEVWARQQGGDGITSVEKTLFIIFRKAIEFQTAPWASGWCRCRNSFGTDYSLYVYWCAGYGLRVEYGYHGSQGWNVGALVRKFLTLGA